MADTFFMPHQSKSAQRLHSSDGVVTTVLTSCSYVPKKYTPKPGRDVGMFEAGTKFTASQRGELCGFDVNYDWGDMAVVAQNRCAALAQGNSVPPALMTAITKAAVVA